MRCKGASAIRLFNRDGEPAADLDGNNVYFDPGSAAIKFLESDGVTVRQSRAGDLVSISRVNARWTISRSSPRQWCSTIPKLIGDSYRLYLLLKNSPKAIITAPLACTA